MEGYDMLQKTTQASKQYIKYYKNSTITFHCNLRGTRKYFPRAVKVRILDGDEDRRENEQNKSECERQKE